MLTFSIMNSSYDIVHKHTGTVACLSYCSTYAMLFSGSTSGELCKFNYRDKRLHFAEKAYLYSQINNIKVDEDLKIVLACSGDGCVWMLAVESLDIIRAIKVEQPVLNFCLLRYPFYNLFLLCRDHQYCFSINGAKLE